MHTDTSTTSKHKRQGRSAVSNGTKLLNGVDGRSPTARRFRDLVDAYSQALGQPFDQHGEATRNTIRQAVSAQLHSEQMQSAIVRGEAVDGDQLVRVSNLSVRLLRSLGLGPSTQVADEPDLADYLAGRGQAA
jgi:hypothetical protein